jgi:hypothetical protein
MQEAPSICAKDGASDVGKTSLFFPNTIQQASSPSPGSTLLYCRARLFQRLHSKQLAIRWLPSARFEQRCSSLDIWRCFRRARRVIVPPLCNNQQRQPANTTPHLLPCSEATLDCRSRRLLQLIFSDNAAAPCVQTLHLPEGTLVTLAPPGCCSTSLDIWFSWLVKSDASFYPPQREIASAPRACHRVNHHTLACATTCKHSSVRPVELSLRIYSHYSALCSDKEK